MEQTLYSQNGQAIKHDARTCRQSKLKLELEVSIMRINELQLVFLSV